MVDAGMTADDVKTPLENGKVLAPALQRVGGIAPYCLWLLLTAGALLLTFAIGSTVQAIFVFRPDRLSVDELVASNPLLPQRLLVNVVTVALVLLVCALVRPNERRPGIAAIWVVAVAVAAGFGRHGGQLLLGIYVGPSANASVLQQS